MYNDLKLIVPSNFEAFGNLVNFHINKRRFTNEDHLIRPKLERFSNGEGKCVLEMSVRNQDVYILSDIGNYDVTYECQRGVHHMMPDEHSQDIKRIISAISGHAKKITLVMPLLYASRQDKRTLRESLDCAMFLQDMQRYGGSEIVSFDIHNPIVANAIPNMPLSNAYATGELLLSILTQEAVDLKNIIVVGPDEGARNKARFIADLLGGARYGNFDKRRDWSKTQSGGNPIVYHEFVGPDRLDGADVFVVDDMIASGTSLIDTAQKLKQRGANRIYLMTTFALFTKGVSMYDEGYESNIFTRVYSTNLTYVPEEIKEKEWYREVDCSKQLAEIIMEHSVSGRIEDADIVEETKLMREVIGKKKGKK